MSECASKKTRKKDVKKAMRKTIRKRGRMKSRKLVKKTKASSTGWSKEQIKELLQKLAKKKKNKVRLEDGGTIVVWNDLPVEQAALPIAKQIAQMNLAAKSCIDVSVNAESEGESSMRTEPSSAKDTTDLDEEIKRLEEELAEDDMEEDESDTESMSSRRSHIDFVAERKVSFTTTDTIHSFEALESKGQECIGPAILSLSSLADERISPLPHSALPAVRKRTLKGIDEPASKKAKPTEKVDGLRGAVKELLDGYVARSKEKLSGYCRVCAKQFKTDEEFHAHRRTDFHKVAVEMERKATYCKLCRKQLTSPVQMREHLSSRPHREKLSLARRRQSGQRMSQGPGRQRQWC